MKIIEGKASAAVQPYEFTVTGAEPRDRCVVTEIDYQRNGVSGNGFFVCRFVSSSHPEGTLLGVVFYEPKSCAIVDPHDLTHHFRGDYYEDYLREAIKARWEQIWNVDPEPPNPQNNVYSGDNVRDLQDMRDTGRPGL